MGARRGPELPLVLRVRAGWREGSLAGRLRCSDGLWRSPGCESWVGFPPPLGMIARLSKAGLTLAGEGDSEVERVDTLSSAPRPKIHFHP